MLRGWATLCWVGCGLGGGARRGEGESTKVRLGVASKVRPNLGRVRLCPTGHGQAWTGLTT